MNFLLVWQFIIFSFPNNNWEGLKINGPIDDTVQ